MPRAPAASSPILLSLLLLAACGPENDRQDIEFRVPVSVQEVKTGVVEDLIVTTGVLRATESVVLNVETRGLLSIARHARDRRLAEGDHVEAGQTIAEITGEEARIEARTEATESRYLSALRELESRRLLLESGLIPAEEVRRLEAVLAEAELERDRSLLAAKRSRLVTPISGVLLRLARDEKGLPVADGQLVARGFEVAQIAPLSQLIADVDLVGPDLARVRPGLEARMHHYAFERFVFPGTVLRLAPTLDPTTHTLRAEVELGNPQELLRPGMFIEVLIVAERRENVPVVPRQSVTERGGERVIFVLSSQRVSRRKVVLGLGDDDVVEVRQGVESGERIVVRGLETLTDGTRVRVSGQ